MSAPLCRHECPFAADAVVQLFVHYLALDNAQVAPFLQELPALLSPHGLDQLRCVALALQAPVLFLHVTALQHSMRGVWGELASESASCAVQCAAVPLTPFFEPLVNGRQVAGNRQRLVVSSGPNAPAFSLFFLSSSMTNALGVRIVALVPLDAWPRTGGSTVS